MRKFTSRYGRVTAVASATALVGASIFGTTTAAFATSGGTPSITKLSVHAIDKANNGVSVVDVTGKNFTGVTGAQFGSGNPTGVSSVAVKVLSDTQAQVTVTNGATGPSVASALQLKLSKTSPAVSTADTTADDIDVVAPLDLSGATNIAASTLLDPYGKSVITVTGLTGMGATATAFKALGITATVDGDPATVAWVDATSVKITAPAGTPGGVVPVALNLKGVAGVPDATNVKYAAVVKSLSYTSAPVTGSTKSFVITGKGLDAVTAPTINSVSLTGCTVDTNKTKITCTGGAPATAAGTYAVGVTPVVGTTLGKTAGRAFTVTDLS
jgi:hypothetical protein